MIAPPFELKNHLVCKRALKHLAKLAWMIELWCEYFYVFKYMFFSGFSGVFHVLLYDMPFMLFICIFFHVFQSEFALYSFLSVKELLDINMPDI